MSRPIWPTEEYAIRDFISGCRVQIILVIIAPHIEIDKIEGRSSLFTFINIKAKRRIP